MEEGGRGCHAQGPDPAQSGQAACCTDSPPRPRLWKNGHLKKAKVQPNLLFVTVL